MTLLGQHVLDLVAKRGEEARRVVLPVVGTHAVKSSVIHQVGFLERRLPLHDVAAGHDDLTGPGYEPIRPFGCHLVGGKRAVYEDGDGDYHRNQQSPLEVGEGAVPGRPAAGGQ